MKVSREALSGAPAPVTKSKTSGALEPLSLPSSTRSFAFGWESGVFCRSGGAEGGLQRRWAHRPRLASAHAPTISLSRNRKWRSAAVRLAQDTSSSVSLTVPVCFSGASFPNAAHDRTRAVSSMGEEDKSSMM